MRSAIAEPRPEKYRIGILTRTETKASLSTMRLALPRWIINRKIADARLASHSPRVKLQMRLADRMAMPAITHFLLLAKASVANKVTKAIGALMLMGRATSMPRWFRWGRWRAPMSAFAISSTELIMITATIT